MLDVEPLDVVSVRPVCRQPGTVRVRHQTPGTGRRLDPVGASSVLCPVLCVFVVLSRFKSGEHRTVRCSASGALCVCRPP